MSQTTYEPIGLGAIGSKANSNVANVENPAAAENIFFGRLVSSDANGDAVLGTAKPLGVSMRSLQIPVNRDGSAPFYPTHAESGVSVMTDGYIVVSVIDGCAKGGEVYASDTTVNSVQQHQQVLLK